METADSECRRGTKVGCTGDQRQMGVFLAAKWIKSGCEGGLRFLSVPFNLFSSRCAGQRRKLRLLRHRLFSSQPA